MSHISEHEDVNMGTHPDSLADPKDPTDVASALQMQNPFGKSEEEDHRRKPVHAPTH